MISEFEVDEQQNRQQLDPFQFTKTVLENCGQVRFKDKRITKTDRGQDFLRKLPNLNSSNPAQTFYGTDN